MKILIAYASYSGNTEEVAQLIADELRGNDFSITLHRMGFDRPVNVKEYDVIFLGTFTWSRGSTPDEVKDFVWEVGYKPERVAVFGTGETQFGGDELFCLAAHKLAKFYESQWPVLQIEQSPRGSQEEKVKSWIEGVLAHDIASIII